ncbi:MAG: hypothetical protein E7605_00480 [Ruminococcaceae bacterium]|nr:hypothetical protein [Oscillospiraceae bacterium]
MKTDRAQRLIGKIGDQYVSLASDAVEAFSLEEERRKRGRGKLRLIAAAAAAVYIVLSVCLFLGLFSSPEPPEPSIPPDTPPSSEDPDKNPPEPPIAKPLPDHLTLPEGIEPKENEIIYQVALTSPSDQRSYIRLTYSDSSRQTLTGIYLHQGTGKKGYRQNEIQLLPDNISNFNIIILSYYPEGPAVRNDQPTVLVFCRYITMAEEATCYKATVTQYFQEKSALSGAAGWYDYYRLIDMQFATSIQYNYETQLSLARRAYDNHYKQMFEKYSPAYVDGKTTYHFDLIYSSIGGEEIMLQKDFTEFIPCPGY